MSPSNFIDLLEQAGPHQFSCTMLNMPEEVSSACKELADQVGDDDLSGDGRETDFHTTLKYGTHTSDVEDIKRVLAQSGLREIEFTITGLSTFPPSEHSDNASVLKLDVESDDLIELNRAISDELVSTDSFPVYHAHITIAYVKPDAIDRYLKLNLNGLSGSYMSSKLTFSSQDGARTEIDLATL